MTTEERPIALDGGRRGPLSRSESQAMTRERLLEAAAEVFAAKGFRVATLADIAAHAGYTIGAVYSNFGNKNALIQALMSDRLRRLEAELSTSFAEAAASPTGSAEARIERELDRLEASEDAVPIGWWRLLNEYRAYVADHPGARAELDALDRRCREIIARHVERFAADVGLDLPMPPIALVELTNALTDGLRLAHAEGRASMTSGAGLRMVVSAMIRAAARHPDP